jgi:hypothetical protein
MIDIFVVAVSFQLSTPRKIGPHKLEGRVVAPYLPCFPLPRPGPEGLPVLLGQLPPGPGCVDGRELPWLELDLAMLSSSVLHSPGLGKCVSGDYEGGRCVSAGLLAR